MASILTGEKSSLDGTDSGFPDDQAYVQFHVHDTIAQLISRISARMFVGQPVCRDEEWLHIAKHYTYDVYTTVINLRKFPKYLHPFVVWFLPSSYKVQHHLRKAKQLISPIVKERRKIESQADHLQERPNDMLQWMMDAATEDEGKPDKLAQRQLILTLASTHATSTAITHALLDLCAYPEYLAILREEVDSVYENEEKWEKSTLNKLEKMDSFLKESQRFNPPSLCKLTQPEHQLSYL